MDRPADDPRAGNRLDVVHLNEVKGDAGVTAHLLEFDSLRGRWRQAIAGEGETIRIDDRRLGFSSAALPGEVLWGDLGCDIVLECTGKFLKPEQLQVYFDRGVKKVIVAAPVKHPAALNLVVGVNRVLDDRRRKAMPAIGEMGHARTLSDQLLAGDPRRRDNAGREEVEMGALSDRASREIAAALRDEG
jgi:hypothetical protein